MATTLYERKIFVSRSNDLFLFVRVRVNHVYFLCSKKKNFNLLEVFGDFIGFVLDI